MKAPVTFAGLPAEVLSLSKKGDGTHRVLKVILEGKPLVLKCYGLKVSRLQAALRQYGVRLIIGKSAYSVEGRFRTERGVLELWRKEGFDVPEILSPHFLSGVQQPCLALEWLPGPTLATVLRSPEASLDRKQKLVEQFAAVMGKRHERAIALREPRFIFEHPTFSHVIVSGDRLVHFDFEIAFTGTRDVERIVRHEIAGFLQAMPMSNSEHALRLLETLVGAYPNRALMRQTLAELRRYGAVALAGWLEPFQKCMPLLGKKKKIAAAAEELMGCLNDSCI